jgi:hypothetical protein
LVYHPITDEELLEWGFPNLVGKLKYKGTDHGDLPRDENGKPLYLLKNRYRKWFWEKKCNPIDSKDKCLLKPGHPGYHIFDKVKLLNEKRGY